MRKIGIFGGSFNPIHMGHLITANAIREIRNLDTIIFIPCFISPHKTDRHPMDSKYRMEMVKLAIEGNSHFSCSDYEIQKTGVSYSIDTIRYFKQQHPELELIIGYDNLVVFDTWKDPREIVKLVKLVVLKRKLDNSESVGENEFFKFANIIQTPVIEISSSIIRERIKEKKSFDYLVPEKVKKYIVENNLYV